MTALRHIYRKVLNSIGYLYSLGNDLAGLLSQALVTPFSFRKSDFFIFKKNLWYHIYLGGVSTFQAVTLLGSIMGAVILLVVLSAFADTPVEGAMGRVYAIGFLQIIAPLLISFVVTACYTPAISYEVTHMRGSGEFELLLATGVNPIIYLVCPIFYATVVIISSHIVFFMAALLTGSYVMSLLMPVFNFGLMVDVFYRSIEASDLLVMTFKVFIISSAIALFPLRESLQADPYHARIPDLTTRAAKNIILYLAIAEILLALHLYT
ncbi:MAG: ABC transporter permease [Spirochaetales bacterium]|nr:ABC transporter permease [Spirochaetales bacterium]